MVGDPEDLDEDDGEVFFQPVPDHNDDDFT
jgi:hypothetical protein